MVSHIKTYLSTCYYIYSILQGRESTKTYYICILFIKKLISNEYKTKL